MIKKVNLHVGSIILPPNNGYSLDPLLFPNFTIIGKLSNTVYKDGKLVKPTNDCEQ